MVGVAALNSSSTVTSTGSRLGNDGGDGRSKENGRISEQGVFAIRGADEGAGENWRGGQSARRSTGRQAPVSLTPPVLVLKTDQKTATKAPNVSRIALSKAQ